MSSPVITQLQRDLVGDKLCVCTASGAIPIVQGIVILDSPSEALAMTLAAPIAGSQDQGGNDGCVLIIVCAVSSALTLNITHTVTCPANTIRGSLSVISFVPNQGESCTLIAYGGDWYNTAGTAGPTS